MRLFRSTWLIAALLASAACHKLTTLTTTDITAMQPSRIWVTHPDHSLDMTEVNGPRIFNDTLVGYVNGEFTELPVAGFTKMVIRQPARAKTIALFAAGTIAVAGVVWWVAGGGKSDDPKFYFDCMDDPDLPECQ